MMPLSNKSVLIPPAKQVSVQKGSVACGKSAKLMVIVSLQLLPIPSGTELDMVMEPALISSGVNSMYNKLPVGIFTVPSPLSVAPLTN